MDSKNSNKTYYNNAYKNNKRDRQKKRSKYYHDEIVLPPKNAKQRLQSVIDMCRHFGWEEENIKSLIKGWWLT